MLEWIVVSYDIDFFIFVETSGWLLFNTVEWLHLFMAGFLAAHFGRYYITNREDVVVSSLVGAVVSSLFIVFASILLLKISIDWRVGDEIWMDFLEGLATMLFMASIFSLTGGILYAKYKLGISVTEQK